ncbi:hypothetical protein H1D32_02085 [Anaerobacillus sp. CMMVII]|uniref:hypothetical protein n=1 Tax=Anaerobacillus sp. CMMVII TaxID=2755588 RepID=UPI0021B7265B|nr:hypothetical protein [Anaerobacillus sp. CMMVII]MCT8136641.1 hypothetical protein [Anaerobacillus sp. CMMVII]
MTHQYYDICCKHRGKVVTIYEKCGKVHVGKIVNVDHQFVYIEPTSTGVTGYGWGLGWGYPGFGYRPFFPIALAAIGGFALGAALFWW